MRINPDRDAYGEELKSFLEDSSNSIEIVERDDGYMDYHEGIPYYFSEYTDWIDQEKEAIAFCHGRIVDVGCGAGRVALHLQNKGFPVIGIDNSPGAIAICRKREVKNLRNIPFTQIDRSLGKIDTLVLFGNNFGLFANPRRARWLLKRLRSLCSDYALIIAQTTDPYETDNPDHLSYHKRNRERGRMGGQLRIRIRHKRFTGPWFDYLFVSKQELEEMLQSTGWRVRQYIDTPKASYFVILEKVGA